MRDAKAFPRSVHKFSVQIRGLRECHAVHQAVQFSITRLQILEQFGNLFVRGNVAHKSCRAGQIGDQILGFLLQPLVLIGDRQTPAAFVDLLGNGPGNAALVGQSKDYRRLLLIAHPLVLRHQFLVVSSCLPLLKIGIDTKLESRPAFFAIHDSSPATSSKSCETPSQFL